MEPSDSGVYICTATDSYSSFSDKKILRIRGMNIDCLEIRFINFTSLLVFFKFYKINNWNYIFNISILDQSTTTGRPIQNQPEIYITVSDPSIEIVEIGGTVRFRCDARSRRNPVTTVFMI